MQTTATIAIIGENKVALFETGRNHAGENIANLLKSRDPQLPKVRQIVMLLQKLFS